MPIYLPALSFHLPKHPARETPTCTQTKGKKIPQPFPTRDRTRASKKNFVLGLVTQIEDFDSNFVLGLYWSTTVDHAASPETGCTGLMEGL
jgi:hypothetical protein